jgi:hypothetical protein
MVGENASELIHTGMMVMQLGGTIGAFVQTVFNYPTLGDIYKHAADDGLRRLLRLRRQQDQVFSVADELESELKARIDRSQITSKTPGTEGNGHIARIDASSLQSDAPHVS